MTLTLTPIGRVQAPVHCPTQAPKQGYEGARDARVRIEPRFLGRVAALAAMSLAGLACGETTGLAVSAGGPVTGVVRGTITECGTPAAGVRVILHVQQAAVGQARPVNTDIGPDTTDDRGEYLLDVAPGFGVPGAAEVQLRESDDGDSADLASGVLELSLGQPARDTLQLDADLAKAPRACSVADGHSGS